MMGTPSVGIEDPARANITEQARAQDVIMGNIEYNSGMFKKMDTFGARNICYNLKHKYMWLGGQG